MSSTSVEQGILYTNPEEKELSMIFNFHHLKVDYENGEKWSKTPFDFLELKAILNEWQTGMSNGNGWNALFLNNHDQPRANSRFGDVVNYPFETQSMLGQTIQFLRGTPYIYQGEEIGMTDPDYTSIDQYNDIETHNNYQIMLDKGYSEAKAFEIILAKSRDNSRTPMQWDDSENAGFTTGQPWLKVADNYKTINVKNELENGRIFPYYQALIRLRKEYEIIASGTYRGLLLEHPQIMAYVRELDKQQLLVMSNFYGETISLELPEEFKGRTADKLIGNGPMEALKDEITFAPYETVAFLFDK